ncbi:MAG: A/G-specific adenine glycosylase [Lachnospiraceae bacterium]|nr:A/G-specific adenine glycosylase [Lachnospiraceae bacterium]
MRATDYAKIVSPLLAWYETCGRDLPWRETKDPYRIWVSEIMLQQTRVETVRGYYERFLKALPTIRDLSEAKEEELLKLWEGLGYYSRVRNMQKAARTVMEEYDGVLPPDHKQLLSLCGIGPYTAAAVASIAYSIPKAVVDGNVLRVITRLGADDHDISDVRFRNETADLLDSIIPQDNPGAFNQAMMDLGATVCVPNGAPLCDRCPLKKLCRAHRQKTELFYPVKKAAAARKIEKMTVFLIRDGDRFAIRKRPDGGLLAGMYEFPHAFGWLEKKEALSFLKELGLETLRISRIESAKHVFTHKEWHMWAYEARVGEGEKPDGVLFASPQEMLEIYPIPSAFSIYKERIGVIL